MVVVLSRLSVKGIGLKFCIKAIRIIARHCDLFVIWSLLFGVYHILPHTMWYSLCAFKMECDERIKPHIIKVKRKGEVFLRRGEK